MAANSAGRARTTNPQPRVRPPDESPRATFMAILILAGLFLLSGVVAAASADPNGLPVGESETLNPLQGTDSGARVQAAGPTFPSPTAGSSTYFVGAQAPTADCGPTGCTPYTNAGARTTIQVVSQQVTGCLSYWVGDDSAANLWGQVGYYICNGATPVAFYQIWDLDTGTGLTGGQTSVSTGYHTFSMYSQGGNTWAYAVDDTVFGTYDMGASRSLGTYPVQAVSEETLVSGPWIPAEVRFSPAIQTLQAADTYPVGSGWYAAPSAYEPWGGCTSTGAPNNTGGYTCWGIAGNLQDSSIQSNAIVTGGATALLPAGRNLWSGGTVDFTLTANPTSVTVSPGATGTSTLTVGSLGGFTGTVALASSVSPATGLTCTLSSTSIPGGSGTSTLSCSGSAGAYTVTVAGTSGSLTHSTAVSFTVADFTVTASPTSVTIGLGATGTSTITVVGGNGFGGTVTLAATVSPGTGLVCSLSPTSVVGSGTSTLSCTGSASGSYTVTVTGTSGSLSHSAAVTFLVSGGPVFTLSFAVAGGGAGYAAPTLTYVQDGTTKTAALTTSAMAFAVDLDSSWSVTNPLSGSSSSERWQTGQATSGTATTSLTVVFGYVHQFSVDFTYTVRGGGSGYSAPHVTYTTLSAASTVLAANVQVWADAGSAYQYENPLPGSSSTDSWRTNNGSGSVGSSTTYSATYRHQFRVKFKAMTTTGTATPESPLINVTVFGSNVSLSADNVTWVDAGGSYSFPGVFYGPLPGERWITTTPPSGLVLAPMNITAAYAHEYYLAIQVNAPEGGTVSGSPGWYNETASLTLVASANPGWHFQGWIGSGSGSYSGGSTTAAVTMDAPVTETAVFYVGLTLIASDGGSLQYTFGGTSGWVPAGGSETLYLVPGTSVTIGAAPSLFYELEGWSGSATGSAASVVLVANAPASLSATFAMSLYSKADSLLGLAVAVTAILTLALSVRRHRRKKRERALRQARMRARARAQALR